MSIAPVSAPSAWPTSTAVPSSAGLPSASASSSDSSSAAAWFTNYMNETPAQHMRDNILKSLGLTQDDLDKMSPEKRKAVEDEITKKLKDQALQQTDNKKKPGVLVDITA
jgi:hypothetical protein